MSSTVTPWNPPVPGQIAVASQSNQFMVPHNFSVFTSGGLNAWTWGGTYSNNIPLNQWLYVDFEVGVSTTLNTSISAGTTIGFTGNGPQNFVNGDLVDVDTAGTTEKVTISSGAGTNSWTVTPAIVNSHSSGITIQADPLTPPQRRINAITLGVAGAVGGGADTTMYILKDAGSYPSSTCLYAITIPADFFVDGGPTTIAVPVLGLYQPNTLYWMAFSPSVNPNSYNFFQAGGLFGGSQSNTFSGTSITTAPQSITKVRALTAGPGYSAITPATTTAAGTTVTGAATQNLANINANQTPVLMEWATLSNITQVQATCFNLSSRVWAGGVSTFKASGSATPTLVQSASMLPVPALLTTQVLAGATFSATFPNPVTPGNLVVAYAGNLQKPAIPTTTLTTAFTDADATNNTSQVMAYLSNAGSNVQTITFTSTSASNDNHFLYVAEFSGIAGLPLDITQHVINQPATANPIINTAATTQANELVVAGFLDETVTAGSVISINLGVNVANNAGFSDTGVSPRLIIEDNGARWTDLEYSDGYTSSIQTYYGLNLLQGPTWDFEDTIASSGWVANTNCTLSISGSGHYTGNHRLQIQSNAAGAMRATCEAQHSVPPFVPIIGGQSYYAGFYAQNAGVAQAVGADLAFYNSAFTVRVLNVGTKSNDTASFVIRNSGVFASIASDAFAAVSADYTTTAGGGEVHYVDNAFIASAQQATDLLANWIPNQWAGRTVTQGGNTATIASNDQNTLYLSAAWSPSVPSSGSVFTIASSQTWGTSGPPLHVREYTGPVRSSRKLVYGAAGTATAGILTNTI